MKTERIVFVLSILSISVFLFPASATSADAGPEARNLTSLVGDDVGLCVELNKLSHQTRRFARSGFITRLQKLPAFNQLLQSKEIKHLHSVRLGLEKLLRQEKLNGKPLRRLVDEMFGESVVLAVYPREGREPAGVLMTRAKSEATITEIIRLWKLAEPDNKTTTRTFLKTAYSQRTRPQKTGRRERSLFYARLQKVFVVSDQEEMIHKVILLSRRKAGSAVKPLEKSKRYLTARKSLRGSPVLTAYLNPRAWDSVLKLPKQSTEPQPMPVRFWKSCRWVMGSVRLDDGIILDAVLDYDFNHLPSRIREAITRIGDSADMLKRIPATAVIAFAGRYDPAAVRMVIHGLEAAPGGEKLKQFRKTGSALLLGFDPVEELLPHLRQGIVFYVIARKAGPPGTVPFHGLLALEIVKAVKPGNAPPQWRGRLDSGANNLLRFFTNLYNVKTAQAAAKGRARFATVKSKTTGNTRIHWIDSIAGFQPAIGISPAYLVLSSSPDLIRQFLELHKNGRLVEETEFQSLRQRFFANANQILFVNSRLLQQQIRAYLKSQQALRSKGGPAAAQQKAGKELQVALQAFGLVDSLFVAASVGKSRIRLTIGGVTRAGASKPKVTRGNVP